MLQPFATYIAIIISLDTEQVSRRLAPAGSCSNLVVRVGGCMQSASRFAGLLLFAALLVGAPLLSAKEKRESSQEEWCEQHPTNCVKAPDSHGGTLLLLTAGVLGAAIFVQRRRKAAS